MTDINDSTPAFPVGFNSLVETGFGNNLLVDSDANVVGVILAGGYSALTKGTVLGRITSGADTGKYRPYASTNSDGSSTAAGILADNRDTGLGTTARAQTATMIVSDAIIRNDMVSGADAGAITALGARVDTVFNEFRLP